MAHSMRLYLLTPKQLKMKDGDNIQLLPSPDCWPAGWQNTLCAEKANCPYTCTEGSTGMQSKDCEIIIMSVEQWITLLELVACIHGQQGDTGGG